MIILKRIYTVCIIKIVDLDHFFAHNSVSETISEFSIAGLLQFAIVLMCPLEVLPIQ